MHLNKELWKLVQEKQRISYMVFIVAYVTILYLSELWVHTQRCPSNIYFKCIQLFLKNHNKNAPIILELEKRSRAPITIKLWRMVKDVPPLVQRDRAPLADQEPRGSHMQISAGTLWIYRVHDQHSAHFTCYPHPLPNGKEGEEKIPSSPHQST